jgi:hypothetical protein
MASCRGARALGYVAAFALVAMGSSLAFAQDPANVQRADDLFRQAKALTDAGTYEGACPMLEESRRLDPALGTEFNLADCYEHTHREPEAYLLFSVVATEAHVAGKDVRERESRARMKALEPRIARVHIVRSTGAAAHLRLDGGELRAGSEEAVTSPGRHVIDAAADGREPWHQDLVALAGKVVEVHVPELRPLAAAATASPPPAAVVSPPPATPAVTPPIERAGLGAGRTAALLIGGVGIVGVGVGAVAGVLSISAHGNASGHCPHPSTCGDRQAASDWTTATTDGTISTAGFVAGVVLLGGAGVLWLATGHAESPTPVAFCGRNGCGVGGTF